MLNKVKTQIALAFAESLLESEKFRKELLPAYLKANPIGALNVATSFDNAQPHPYDYAKHLVVYQVNVYCMAAMRAIARDVSATPVQIQQELKIDGEWRWVAQDRSNKKAAEIFRLFSRPNIDETWSQLSERWIISKQAAGNGYLVYDDSEEKAELWHIKADWVKVVTNAIGRPEGYKVSNRGLTKRIDLENIIHLKSANPSGEWYGMPPSETIKETIMTKLSLNTYLNTYFKNAGLLGLIVSGKSLDLENEDHRKIIKKEIAALYQGADKAGKTAVFGGDVEAKLMSHALKDMVPDTLDELVRREVCVAYGVPPIKLTILDEATYNNAKEQDRIYQRGTVEPERRQAEEAINLQLIWPRFGEDWRFHYDRSDVLGLQEDRGEKSTYVVREWQGGLIDRNTARGQLGYDQLEDNGDEFHPLRNPQSVRELGGTNGETSMAPLTGKAANPSRLNRWKAGDAQWNKRKKKMLKAVIAFFGEQLERLLEKLKKVTGNGAIRARLELYIKDDIPAGMVNDLFDILEEDKLIALFMAEIMSDLVEEAGQAALNNASIDFAFDVDNPRVVIAIEELTNKIKGINRTTWKAVKGLIGESYEAGESIDVMAERLRKKFDQFSKGRAEVIARTEANKISNSAAFEAYDQAGIDKKEWLSVQDSRVRDAHRIADGEIVNTGEPFIMTGEPLMYPGDGAGSAWNVVNCRCQAVVPEGEIDGL